MSPLFHQRRVNQGAAAGYGVGNEMRIDGRLNQHAVPGTRKKLKGEVKGRYHAGHEKDLIFKDVPPIKPFEPFPDNPYEFLSRHGIPEDTMVRPFMEGFHDGFGRNKIHIRHPQGNNIVAIPFPFDAARAPSLDNLVEIVFHLPAPDVKFFVRTGPGIYRRLPSFSNSLVHILSNSRVSSHASQLDAPGAGR